MKRGDADRYPIVILGGGIIGASTAYYLTKRGYTPIVVERFEVAGCASGKAGGFLAGGWGGEETEVLHREGFKLHAELSQTLNIESYRKLPTLSVAASEEKTRQGGKRHLPDLPSWLDGNVFRCSSMDKETAQVTPKELTLKLMNAAVEKGAKVVLGEAQGLQVAEQEGGVRTVTGVMVGGEVLRASSVLVALGPWSVLAEEWLQGAIRIPMEGIWSTSIIVDKKEESEGSDGSQGGRGGAVQGLRGSPAAMFCEEDGNGCHLEVYPRPDGSVYLCGLGGSKHVQSRELKRLDPLAVVPKKDRVAAGLRTFANLLPSVSKEVDLKESNACLRPCPADGMPMIGAVPTFENAFIAKRHNYWGILWGPVTGQQVAQLMTEGRCDLDLSPFEPGRFGAMKSRDKGSFAHGIKNP